MESNFKQNLRSELDYLGLTVKELSARTGIPKGTLDCYLKVRPAIPPADAAVKIASALEVSVEYLVSGKDKKSVHSYDQTIRAILKILLELTGRDRETVLGLAKVLKEAEERRRPGG
jgi:transcriptional regulator with XRE-family HTH domain